MAKGDVSTITSEVLLIFLIVISLVFEILLHRIEHWVNHRHHHLQAVLKVLYRELMVLGVVSFSFIIYEVTKKPEGSLVLSFEFAHVFIFLLAIFYTIVVLSTMSASLRLSHRWKRMEQIDLVQYLHMKDQYTRLRLRVHKHRGTLWRVVRWWFPNFRDLWRYWQLHEIMAFHDIRFQFIYYRNLPEHFRFSSFLRRIKAVTFVHLVESHWSLWVIFLALVGADIIRRKSTDSPGSDGKVDKVESPLIIVAAILLMIFVQVLAVKIRKIYWELTKNPRIYYEHLQAEDVAQELDEVEKRRAAERQSRRRSRSSNGPLEPDSGVIADDEANDPPFLPDDATEAEMLDPMHLNVPRPWGVPNPDSTSPVYRDRETQAVDDIGSRTPADVEIDMVTPNPPRTSADRRLDVTLTNPRSPDAGSSLDNIAVRHTLDSKAHIQNPGTRSANNSLELVRTNDPRHVRSEATDDHSPSAAPSSLLPTGVTVAIEVRDTAARHSLDISRRPGDPELSRPITVNTKASLAKAAIEAARRRSIDKQFGRYSLDSRPLPPGASSRPAADKQRLDVTLGIGSPKTLPRISSRGVLTDEDGGRASGSDFGRSSVDSRTRAKRSIELVAAMPHEELAIRHHGPEDPRPDRDLEAGVLSSEGLEPSSSQGSKKSLRIRLWGSKGGDEQEDSKEEPHGVRRVLSRHKSHRVVNATIVKNLEHQQNASKMQPANYPWIVKKLIPRLARVAGPVEKLFWFGSHKFFLGCVEFVLFFATVVLSASTGTIFLIAITKKRKFQASNIAAEVLAAIALIFVLVRIAGIIKKYIFILHNAGLVPESVAIQAIYNVSKKKIRLEMDDDGDSDLSGSETEREDEQSALERRKTLGRFFRSEAEIGNIPGIDVADTPRSSASASGSRRRLVLRKLAVQRRMARSESAKDIPPMGDEGFETVPL